MKGKCLCGSVSIEAANSNNFNACHCNMCRRWGGGPLMAMHVGSEIKIAGAEFIKVFDSSDWAERAFCSNCGTHLYYHLKPDNQYIVPVGLFELETDINFSEQIFIDQKPPFYEFANQTEMLTEQQVFEKYAS